MCMGHWFTQVWTHIRVTFTSRRKWFWISFSRRVVVTHFLGVWLLLGFQVVCGHDLSWRLRVKGTRYWTTWECRYNSFSSVCVLVQTKWSTPKINTCKCLSVSTRYQIFILFSPTIPDSSHGRFKYAVSGARVPPTTNLYPDNPPFIQIYSGTSTPGTLP